MPPPLKVEYIPGAVRECNRCGEIKLLEEFYFWNKNRKKEKKQMISRYCRQCNNRRCSRSRKVSIAVQNISAKFKKTETLFIAEIISEDEELRQIILDRIGEDRFNKRLHLAKEKELARNLIFRIKNARANKDNVNASIEIWEEMCKKVGVNPPWHMVDNQKLTYYNIDRRTRRERVVA